MRHTFTHFHLVLDVWLARYDGEPGNGHFWSEPGFERSDLPTVMRKAHDLAARHPLFIES